MLTIPSISLEYVYTTVTALSDPTAATVEFNVTAVGTEPTSGWVAGEWDGAATSIGNGRFKATAKVLVGTGSSFALTDGAYWVWVRVNSAPEAPVRRIGELQVT